MKVALDTTNILGRGAVKDTYNLLADGIKKLIGGLAKLDGAEPEAWAEGHGFSRYFSSSIKGEAEIDWGDEQERQGFLQGIVADADRLLETARERLGATPEGSEQEERIVEEAALLARLLCQDVQRDGDEVALKEGVARDRVVSVHDPEMRHGRKSASKRFSGHKAAIAVDTDTQLITAVAVLPGNAPDAEKALELTRESESNTGAEVEAALGDCAYGDGATREEFENAGYKLRAKLPKRGKKDQLPKEAFRIDLEASSCTCPSGQTTHTLVSAGIRKDRKGRQHQLKRFCFDSAICTACPLRSSCVKACGNKGRTIALHPHERLLQEARAFQESEAFSEYLQRRQAVEHRLARLVQLGIRQARYFGRAKTVFQLLMAATVANLTLVATKTGQMRSRRGQKSTSSSFLSQIWATAKAFWNHLIRYPVDPNLLSRYASPLHTGFRPHF